MLRMLAQNQREDEDKRCDSIKIPSGQGLLMGRAVAKVEGQPHTEMEAKAT
ncbi:hypothetical protein [Lihuaxuella thermophila]|uniref:Uncharacterized protein n=1 Tax=Lihuaxuella thermophila TaxID=1173111 RepID=A0A1H8FYB9_9BACL|nr:hypothetical protein [Lihuaxuella thermophila]SEN36649.1 hypothetical protein SAMN05444955_109143 [Lihuaxuella thermophila]